ncbi:hypothetical protein [Vibrio campbellii]|uniref:hypothetical protein n=1 Tax=Vibrio campbellii TaxID=680 RepID=UPI00142E1474|nr:hypothetical protein [Vibrio campbellii]NIY87953.1 hypothetical protein [Vibrio campbellii]NVK67965.1 hypothetical protein [Vibrio campbellii]
MLLWITESSSQTKETNELIIRSPDQISAINPNEPAFVVIDSRPPTPEVMAWASMRRQATLWWKPTFEVPKAHCYVDVVGCSAPEFVPLLSEIYHRNGVVNVSLTELESAVKVYDKAQVFMVSSDSGSLLHHQCWPLGYLIHRDSNASIDDFQRVTELGRNRFNIKEMINLIVPDDGRNLLLTFSKA